MNLYIYTLNIYQIADIFTKDAYGLIALIVVVMGLAGFFAFKSWITSKRINLDVEDNRFGFCLRANFPVDTGNNGKVIPNIMKTLPFNQTPIRENLSELQ
jgi:hypothetical protein